jgi:transposase
LVFAVLEKGLPAKVINPARIRNYAKSCGMFAKTDKIDAKLIAQFAAERNIKTQEKQSRKINDLKGLMALRRALVACKRLLKAQMELQNTKFAIAQANEEIKHLDEKIKKIEKKVLSLIEDEKELKENFDILKTIPGVGDIVAATLVYSSCFEISVAEHASATT